MRRKAKPHKWVVNLPKCKHSASLFPPSEFLWGGRCESNCTPPPPPPPQGKTCCSVTIVTVFWNRVFAAVIELRCVYSKLGCILGAMANVLLRGPYEDRDTQRCTREHHVMSQNTKNCPQPPKARWEPWARFSLRALRGKQPCCHLDFTQTASRTMRECISVVWSCPAFGNWLLRH